MKSTRAQTRHKKGASSGNVPTMFETGKGAQSSDGDLKFEHSNPLRIDAVFEISGPPGPTAQKGYTVGVFAFHAVACSLTLAIGLFHAVLGPLQANVIAPYEVNSSTGCITDLSSSIYSSMPLSFSVFFFASIATQYFAIVGFEAVSSKLELRMVLGAFFFFLVPMLFLLSQPKTLEFPHCAPYPETLQLTPFNNTGVCTFYESPQYALPFGPQNPAFLYPDVSQFKYGGSAVLTKMRYPVFLV